MGADRWLLIELGWRSGFVLCAIRHLTATELRADLVPRLHFTIARQPISPFENNKTKFSGILNGLLAEIRRDYWRSAQWSYYFLADDKDEMHQGPHVWPIFNTLDQGERYFDVRVNRAQASRAWPQARNKDL